jgi:hypothetical protein
VLAVRQTYCLTIAAANKDTVMFNELWSNNLTWNNEHHFVAALNLVTEQKWEKGIAALLKASTTELIVASADPKAQNRIAEIVLAVRRASSVEVVKIINEAIISSPANIFVIHNLLRLPKDSTDSNATRMAEIKSLVPKIKDALYDTQVGHFRLGEFYSEFNSNSSAVGEILRLEAEAEIARK